MTGLLSVLKTNGASHLLCFKTNNIFQLPMPSSLVILALHSYLQPLRVVKVAKGGARKEVTCHRILFAQLILISRLDVVRRASKSTFTAASIILTCGACFML